MQLAADGNLVPRRQRGLSKGGGLIDYTDECQCRGKDKRKGNCY